MEVSRRVIFQFLLYHTHYLLTNVCFALNTTINSEKKTLEAERNFIFRVEQIIMDVTALFWEEYYENQAILDWASYLLRDSWDF